jgi:cytochrome P450
MTTAPRAASASIGTPDEPDFSLRPLAEFAFPSEEVTQCPFPFYAALRAEAPVYKYPGRPEYLIARREEILFVLQHPDVFSNRGYLGDSRLGQKPFAYLDEQEMPEGAIATPYSMAESDLPEHTVKRRSAMPLVAKEKLEEARPVIEANAHRLIDGFAARGACEFRSEFADPLAVLSICELAGFPPDDRDVYLTWRRITPGHGRRYLTAEQLAEQDRDLPDQAEYCRRIILDRHARPRDDFLSRMIAQQVDRDGEVNLPYLVSEVNLILVAGNETTSRLLTNTMLLLLRNPDQLAKVLADRSLVRGAIEESLRCEAPTQWTSRYVLRDTQVGGVPIPQGSFVMLMYGSANRDETWEEPDRFRVDRPDVHRYHMAFGGGLHFCLGAPLARLEGQVALDIVLDRLRNIRPAPGRNDFANIDNFEKRVPKALYLEFDSA